MNIAELKAQLRSDEGERLKPYLDTMNKWTIGVGRNISDVGISATESDFLLTNDIQRVQAQLNQYLPWWSGLSDNRQLVFANMTFNLGMLNFMQFKKMLAECHAGNFAAAAVEMLDSEWAKQVGDRAHRLALLMEKG